MKKGFTQIENTLITDKKLTDGEFRTYLLLRSYKFTRETMVYPSEAVLAARRGKTVRTLITHLKGLSNKGYIKFHRRGFNKTNLYEFTGEVLFTSVKQPSSHIEGKKLHSNNTEKNKTLTNKQFESGKRMIEEIRQRYTFLNKKK